MQGSGSLEGRQAFLPVCTLDSSTVLSPCTALLRPRHALMTDITRLKQSSSVFIGIRMLQPRPLLHETVALCTPILNSASAQSADTHSGQDLVPRTTEPADAVR